MKKLLFIAVIVCCFQRSTAQTKNSDTAKWEYSDKTDEMTSEKSYFASLYCEPLEDHNITTVLTTRYMHGKNEILFFVDKALFNSISDGEVIYVKFDDNKIETFRCTNASNNIYNLLFIGSEKKFMKELLSAKKLLIKVNLYREGDTVFHFNVEGLNWNHI